MTNKRNNSIILGRILRIGISSSPLVVSLYAVLLLLQSTIYFFMFTFEQRFFDSLYYVSKNGLKAAVILLITLVALRLGVEIINSMVSITSYQFIFRFNRYIRERLIVKTRTLDLIHFEDVELYRDFEKGGVGAPYQASVIIEEMLKLCFGYFLTMMAVTGFLATLHPLLSILLLITVIPKLINFFLKGKWQKELIDSTTPFKREEKYYGKCIYDIEYYKETRLLGCYAFFITLWRKTWQLLNREILRFNNRVFRGDMIISLMDFLCFGASFTLAVSLFSNGEISIGGLGATLSAITTLAMTFDQFIRYIGSIIQNLASARYMINILLREERVGKEQTITRKKIEVENISFRYPSAKRDSIKDLSLTISKGETVAIVGINGAGKTTLIKLILGLLLPKQGRVLHDGCDTVSINEYCFYKNTSAVLQTFGKYKVTLGENVHFCDQDSKEQRQKALSTLERIDFHINNRQVTAEDLDISLGREFGGIELSGGQWQQVAIARGLYKIYDTIVLDEPTAAIDPVKEAQIYRTFLDLCQGKTGIIVTHRLGSISIVDRIIVMDKGRVIEEGTHKNLMERGGIYTEMFNRQASWYERKTSGP